MFVRFSTAGADDVVLNADHVRSFDQLEGWVRLRLSNGEDLLVQETMDQVTSKLNDARLI